MNRWFADLPELADQIDIADCEMVAGSDTMIDVLSRGKKEVTLQLSSEKTTYGTSPTYIAAMSKEEDNCDYGANYDAAVFDSPSSVSLTYKGSAWLCPVTEMIFGEYPERIYIYYK